MSVSPFALLLLVHLACAAGATLTFWCAAAAPKGGVFHRRAGRGFAWAVYATALTGGVMAVARLVAPGLSARAVDFANPAVLAAERQVPWLVLYVLVILVAPTHHGLAVVRAGRGPAGVRSRTHAALAFGSMLASLVILPAALLWQYWQVLIVAPIGLVIGLRHLAYASRPSATSAEVQQEHLVSMLTAGVVLHTALLVFGTSRTLGWSTTGWESWCPWLVSALVGVPVMVWQWRARGRMSRVAGAAS